MKRLLISILTALIFLAVALPTRAQISDGKRTDRIKQDVNKFGVDEQVDVRLSDQSRLTGRITQIGETYFVLIDKRTADSRMLRFADVRQVKRVSDNPFGDPGFLIGISMIPLIVAVCVVARSR